MIDLNDVLLAISNIPVDAPIAEIWGRGLQGGYKIIEYTGVLPITISANGEVLLDYRIYGNTVQNGTPTPENPIMPSGCGVQTENLWDKDVPKYVYTNDYKKYNPDNAIALKAGTYTLSSDGMLPIIQAFSEDHTQLNVGDMITYMSNYYLMWDGRAIGPTAAIIRETIITLLVDCILTFCVSSNLGTYLMLNLGSTALPYEPYGYKLPMTVSDGDKLHCIPVYIGENQLDAGEYVSFSEQKIYRDVGGTLTPTDPPVPLPEIPTIKGETVMDYDGDPKPSQMYVKYKGKGVQ